MKNLGSTTNEYDIATKQAVDTEFASTLPVRENSTAYVANERVLYPGKYSWVMVCTTAGTSAATAPAWPTTITSGTTTLTDGTAVWTIYDMTEGAGLSSSEIPLRANSVAYVAGDRVLYPGKYTYGLICSTAGTSAATAPTWPTTITSGTTTLTDGTAVWTIYDMTQGSGGVSATDLPIRANSVAYAAGDRVLFPGKYTYGLVCTTAGTSDATQPTWPTSVTSGTTTLTDGTAVWTIYDMTQGGGVNAGDLPIRANSVAYASGDRVLYPGKYSWTLICTTAGTSGTAVPSWPTTIVSGTTTITDGTAVWTIYDLTQGSGISTSEIPIRENSSAYAVGDRVLYPGKYTYGLVCSTAGTSDATAPAWPSSISSGSTLLADGTAVWTIYDMTQGGSPTGGTVITLTSTISVGSTTCTAILPKGSTFIDAKAYIGTTEVMTGIDAAMPTATNDGFVTFTIGAAATTAITCIVTYATSGVHDITNVLAAGNTTITVAVPANKTITSTYALLGTTKVMLTTDVVAPTISTAGSVTFSIAQPYTDAIDCFVVYSD